MNSYQTTDLETQPLVGAPAPKSGKKALFAVALVGFLAGAGVVTAAPHVAAKMSFYDNKGLGGEDVGVVAMTERPSMDSSAYYIGEDTTDVASAAIPTAAAIPAEATPAAVDASVASVAMPSEVAPVAEEAPVATPGSTDVAPDAPDGPVAVPTEATPAGPFFQINTSGGQGKFSTNCSEAGDTVQNPKCQQGVKVQGDPNPTGTAPASFYRK